MITSITDEQAELIQEKPGAHLAAQRRLRDYSQEYVAGKLHLRVRVIELLEDDDYDNMPEPVFIKGYLRAYAKLLGVPADPLLRTFNLLHSDEGKTEKALWQSRRQSYKGERTIRWMTVVFGLGVLVAVAMWWQSTKENNAMLPTAIEHKDAAQETSKQNDIRLTDLSKMRSLLSSVSTAQPTGDAE